MPSDKFRMDGHKLYWHLDRVQDWLQGRRIAPIHIDVGLSKGCNIRCEYCFGALQGNLGAAGAEIFFPREALLDYVKEAAQLGVRSLAFIGEAEPLINPHVYDAIRAGRQAGLDLALGTNGILLDTAEKGAQALSQLSWIRFNISAASDAAYRRVHGSTQFQTAIENIGFCVATKKQKGLPVTVGLQMVLTPSNVDQVVPLAKLGRELGVDYLVVKQCSDTVANDLGVFQKLGEYAGYADVLKAAEGLGTDGYAVIVKWLKIANRGGRNYARCLGAPFLLYSSGDGKLYPCGMCFDPRLGMEEEYRMGDLTRQSFREILHSQRYWEVVEKVSRIDVSRCYSNCRTHAINEFAWMLKHPPEHVNFI
jgi:MoaA/NifB/PqqE/SkfB family radical SAM enzyme